MLSYYMEEPGLVSSDCLRRNEGLTPAQIKELHGPVDFISSNVSATALNGNLGIIPDWQFYPQPPPHGTGKYSNVTVDIPPVCSYGISGASLGQPLGLTADDADAPPLTACQNVKGLTNVIKESGEDASDIYGACFLRASEANNVKLGGKMLSLIKPESRGRLLERANLEYGVSQAYVDSAVKASKKVDISKYILWGLAGLAVGGAITGVVIFVRRGH